ncbi:MAG: hypothetical protein HEP71_13200 [Roseivirga sp.]|nr:hypothetical protein [Roseivirga sp.]
MAKKDDWKTKEMPDEVDFFDLNKVLSIKEYEQLCYGLIPSQMEDKWFIYVENETIYFHRSWVGSCIYQVTIEKQSDRIILTRTVVNRNRDQYKFKDNAEDQRVLGYLIDRLLVGKNVPFPTNDPSIPEQTNYSKHNIVGYGRANTEE